MNADKLIKVLEEEGSELPPKGLSHYFDEFKEGQNCRSLAPWKGSQTRVSESDTKRSGNKQRRISESSKEKIVQPSLAAKNSSDLERLPFVILLKGALPTFGANVKRGKQLRNYGNKSPRYATVAAQYDQEDQRLDTEGTDAILKWLSNQK